MEHRHLSQERLAELHGLIEQLRDGWAKLRTIDPTDRVAWVRERHTLADIEARVDEIWPGRAEPLEG
jgi:hypothetical protein